MSPILKISFTTLILNILLSITKLFVGLQGHSSGLVADSVHSISDVITTVIVIVAYFISHKHADKTHQYGHDKYESLASFGIAIILAYTGFKLGYDSINDIIHQNYVSAEIPTMATMIVASVSIILKAFMFFITIRTGKNVKSDSLIADAWHHLSDSLSSVGSLLGIVLARFFHLLIADKIAGILICLFIFKVAYEIGSLAVKKLTDTACRFEEEKRIKDIVNSVSDVKSIDNLKTRLFGDGYYLDLEISIEASMSLYDAHNIAEKLHDKIEEEIPEVKHCMIHINPYISSKVVLDTGSEETL